jgi:hypothetical protein
MRFSLVLLLLLATRLTAQVSLPDLRVQNAGGTVVEIHDVKLLHVDPDGIRVLHSAGSAKIPYELLPDDLQSKYGFNADKAQQHRDEVTAARQTAAAAAVAAAAASAPQPQAQLSSTSVTFPVVASTSTAASAAPTRRTSLGYSLPAIGSTYSSSRSRSRYNYSPSCTAYSPYSYSSSYPVYYNTGSSCSSTTISSGGISMGR